MSILGYVLKLTRQEEEALLERNRLLQYERNRRDWDAICALAPNDDQPFETTLLGWIYDRIDEPSGRRVAIIPSDLPGEACEHGFEILAADAERNAYTLKRITKGTQQ